MRIRTRAPGKLVMAGEYAVLEGAPAVVMALDRHARVELAASADDTFCVDAPDLGIHEVRAQLQGRRLQWLEAAGGDREKLKLVTAVVEYLAGTGILSIPLHMQLDTADFFGPGGRGKLGLGSSAALTVALTAAICTFNDGPVPDAAAMLAMHRHMQGGRGSGLDIATSLHGGTLVYRLREGRPQWRHVDWPADLAWRGVWSGRPASTGNALAKLSQWRSRHEAAFAERIDELHAAARFVVAALDAGDSAGMLDGMTTYAESLATLGRSSGIDIVCAEHRTLAAAAADCGVVYKTCGAGGGDVGVALTRDPDALNHFSRQATTAGFLVLDAGMDPHGLEIQAAKTDNRRQTWTTCA